MRFIFLIFLMIIIAWILPSCRDYRDQLLPEVTYIEPLENTKIDLPDTLHIVADIRDNNYLVSVMITLVNEQGVPVVPAFTAYPDSDRFTLNYDMVIDDKSIPGGTYRLLITAFDGNNQVNSYQTLLLHEVPLELLGFISVTATYPFQATVKKLDPDFNTDTSFIYPEGFLLSGINSLWDQFYFVTPEPSTLYTFSSIDFEQQWEFPAELPRPQFSAIFVDHQLLYATQNGNAGILNNDGNILVMTPDMPGKVIKCFTADENYLYAEVISLSGEQRSVTAFYRSTGAIRCQKIITTNILAMLPVNEKALIITGSGISAVLFEFDPENIKMTKLTTLDEPNVSSAIKISDQDILILSDPDVLEYDYPMNRISFFLPGRYKFGCYDKLYDRLFLATDSVVDVYNRSTQDLVHAIHFDEPVKDFHILYNK